MKYIIMCGGNYSGKFKVPKQLLEVNGEKLVERTIRLLKENGIKDIAISTNNPAFDYIDVEKLKHENKYKYGEEARNIKSNTSWLNAYYPMKKPACYLHGDVYYSDEAIKTIVETPVEDTMFFCIRDISDGRPIGINTKGREPLAYKVENQKVFTNAIKDLKQMIDEGKFENGIEPISWHVYRKINGLDLMCNAKGYNANAIFNTKGDYVVIDDYTTDIDSEKDIPELEKLIKTMKGGIKMIKARVLENFHLGKFGELKNLVRAHESANEVGMLYVDDVFECDEEMAKYLLNETKNPANRTFIQVVEVIPEKPKKEVKKVEVKEEIKEEIKPKRKPRKKTIAND